MDIGSRGKLKRTAPSSRLSRAAQAVVSLKTLLAPLIGYIGWEVVSAQIFYGSKSSSSNPFAPFFLLAGRVSPPNCHDPRYRKSWLDLLFISYYIVFWACVRQWLIISVLQPLGRYCSIRKKEKLDRFGEQGYAMIYFAVMGAWGYRIMGQLPTWWYKTDAFWIDYPHWDMHSELKRYYLMQMSFWFHELLVLLLGLEKPRSDYYALVAHHYITLWLVGWSYLMNLTLIGNAVYMSMDIPDACLSFSKVLNYIHADRAKVVSFAVAALAWTHLRHILNFYILYSVWFEYDLVPETSRLWKWSNGTYLTWWMKYQIFVPLLLLQALNIYWYRFILRILVRAFFRDKVDDERSDNEDDEERE
ncbi:hypothetical protein D9757_000722 [Collybiopsis confluens]|uniref:TLC domain-containing protein n=1 Tax=Collybiopsis confluens TaxID=2823264 RepID=A0A8H5I1U7_9AGAR|nr:hypothetical protein D9757_000722 [Collybiopsis confluens]